MKFRAGLNYKKLLLKCYQTEVEKYKYLYFSLITPDEASRIIRIVKKRYKLGKTLFTTFDLESKQYGGLANRNGWLQFGKRYLNIGIVCHELSHLIMYKRKYGAGHSRVFYNIMDEVVRFISGRLTFIIK